MKDNVARSHDNGDFVASCGWRPCRLRGGSIRIRLQRIHAARRDAPPREHDVQKRKPRAVDVDAVVGGASSGRSGPTPPRSKSIPHASAKPATAPSASHAKSFHEGSPPKT